MRTVQGCDLIDAQMQHGVDEFAIEVFQHSVYAASPTERQRPPNGTSDSNRIGAESERLGDIHAAPDATVHDDGGGALQSVGDLRADPERCDS
jgi:hypothetical protein